MIGSTMAGKQAPSIAGGKYRGTKLQVAEGKITRPMRTRVRESLFDILGDRVHGARVVDLYAGSGSLGLEALSRGARHCTFVETNRLPLAALRKNLQACKITEEEAIVLPSPVEDADSLLEGPFSIVFADPPFVLGQDLPSWLEKDALVAEDGVLVQQISADRIPIRQCRGFSLTDERGYGSSTLCIYFRNH
ncbi:MAG: 16S rRNA (guanine(966)-N(2))-methyltransferase RsmD [Planctomycetota bacterium]|nr:16S rRNA (guanine(966)-N(2))-methyltransferase RsmD [Planctomycetota bacterium]